jgi:NTE family protein
VMTDEQGPDPGTVAPVEDDRSEEQLEGVALCLSGGGYRAMLFHVGALWRLNELGYLPRLARVSSVSGGSITAATLGVNWQRLSFTDAVASPDSFKAAVVTPLRRLAGIGIDKRSVLGGILSPRTTIADEVAKAYSKHLFGDATLQALPEEPAPLFVINSTNLMTGKLWRFSRAYMADWSIGTVWRPQVPLATAVAASSAFPPFLSPLRLAVDPSAWEIKKPGENSKPPYTERAVLSDGGVYDNLGLETAWKNHATILVSDGGGHMQSQERVAGDWAWQSYRVNSVIDNQVRSLRKRATIAGFTRGDRTGTYWGIRGDVADYRPLPPDILPTPHDKTIILADVRTALSKLDGTQQERLVNWGYAACDVAMRRWVEREAPAPGGFPYPKTGVG